MKMENRKKMQTNKYATPLDDLSRDARAYLDTRLDDVKLNTAKGLSQASGILTSIILLFIVAGAFLLILSAACVIRLGEVMNSYSLAAFVVAGVLLLILLVLVLLRNHLFTGTYKALFLNLFFPDNAPKEELDIAILKNQVKMNKQEAKLTRSYMSARDYYTPSRIVGEALSRISAKRLGVSSDSLIPALIRLIFGYKRKKS